MRSDRGISLKDWEEMFERQGRSCAICGTTKPGSVKGWHTDHNHACCATTPWCGKCIRGILCSGCNVGLGHFREDPAIMAAAVAYLRR